MKTKTKTISRCIHALRHSPLSHKSAVALFLIVPFLASMILQTDTIIRNLFYYSSIFLGCISALLLTNSNRWTSVLRWPVLGVISLLYLGLYGLFGYQLIVQHTFDPTFVDFGFDIASLVDLIGFSKTIVLGIASTAVFVALALSIHTQSKHLQTIVQMNTVRVCMMLVAISVSVMHIDDVYGQHITKPQLERNDIIITPKNETYTIESDENVMILQLESTNALAMAGYLEHSGKKYDGFYMPHMKYVARDGTFFPLAWGNQQQTIRAQEAIICGVPGNTGGRLAKRTDDIPVDCLPKQLADNGYDSIFMKGADNPNFMNTSDLMNAAGFTELHFGDIMKEGDKNYGWGFDDCTFYKRAFEYLKKEHSEKKKKFVYFEVGSNHANFGPKKEYAFTHMLDGSENYLAKYINSTLQQDYCVSKFYENFKQYAPNNTHLFIVGDHPWGLQEGWARYAGHAENFLVPMAYIPPRSRKEEFKSMHTVTDYYYSHSDMTPTIMSLLTNKGVQNSFTFELKKPSMVAGLISHMSAVNYEQCHVLHELYDGGVTAVVQGLKKYTYVHAEETVYFADLSEDILEKNRIVLEEDADFSEFIQKYTCDRFEIEAKQE